MSRGITWGGWAASALLVVALTTPASGAMIPATTATLSVQEVGLVAGMAVPAVLIAYGAALRLGPLPSRGARPTQLALVTGLKLVAQPLGAYLAGWALGLSGAALLALAVTAALPCANNIFVLATRFGRGVGPSVAGRATRKRREFPGALCRPPRCPVPDRPAVHNAMSSCSFLQR